MKIALFSLFALNPGKYNVKDSRLDQMFKITGSKKKTYLQVELVGEEGFLEADAILAAKEASSDLILKDLEFVETRLSRSEDDSEKLLLQKLKSCLEKEQFISQAGLSLQEKEGISGYSLITIKPVILTDAAELTDMDTLLSRVIKESGFLSFFTSGEKETRAWLIKQGTTAWEAAGVIHSDIQKGFIRAEIIHFQDYVQAGGENPAKQAGKMHLESKEYIMQYADWVNFRFNK